MSMYITFKKGDEVLFDVCRTEPLYEFLNEYVPYGDYATVSISSLQNALQDLEESRKVTNRSLESYREAIKHQMTYDELLQTISYMQDNEEMLKQFTRIEGQIYLLLAMADGIYNKDESQKLKWSIG